MGVSSTTNRVKLAGNGSSTTFAFPYYFFNQSDLLVFVYDTLLGGITSYILNTDYTISGTANYQGIYPSGANVVFGDYVPLSTDIVVIVRNPSEVQNFNILENGIIPSTSLVQQLDYLTLLIQRLEDQVSRSMFVPDGAGEAFNGALPSNIALQPLSFPQVNADGDGWQLAIGPSWQTVVIPYTEVQNPSFGYTQTLFSIPPGAMLTGLIIKHSVAFGGVGISDVTAQIGLSGSTGLFIPYFDVAQSVADGAYDNETLNAIESFANSTNVLLTMACTGGAEFLQLSQGSLSIWYKIEQAVA